VRGEIGDSHWLADCGWAPCSQKDITQKFRLSARLRELFIADEVDFLLQSSADLIR
jgi:hypothetical protein